MEEVSPDAIEDAAPMLADSMARVITDIYAGDLLAWGLGDSVPIIALGKTKTGGHFGYFLIVDQVAHRFLTDRYGPTVRGLLGPYGRALETGLEVERFLPVLLEDVTGGPRAWRYEWTHRGPTAWLVGACLSGPKLTGVELPPDRQRLGRERLPLLLEQLIRKNMQAQR